MQPLFSSLFDNKEKVVDLALLLVTNPYPYSKQVIYTTLLVYFDAAFVNNKTLKVKKLKRFILKLRHKNKAWTKAF